jgi:FtsP/CotA-like multicopper oxidase with cupredoxin domain
MWEHKKLLMSLLTIMTALSWSMDTCQAQPTLTPGVNYGVPNFAYSPTTIKKFVDSLPGINTANNLTQQLPLATADTGKFAGADYYEIALVEYREQMHTNLPAVTGSWPNQTTGTKLRGYVQEVNGVAVTTPHYLGPIILATKNRPVRIKFTNRLPATSAGGNLFIPVDTTLMGAGEGPCAPGGGACVPCNPETAVCANYTQNRATIHLHGGIPPWISDGTAHQWITPAAEVGNTPFLKGASQRNVPDMWYDATTKNIVASCAGQLTCGIANSTTDPAGVATFYWTNQQSGRLMFYHDHAVGITGVNVYAGEAAGYVIVDPAEESPLLATGVVPGTIVTNATTGVIQSADLAHLIPLVIQDKSFVPASVLTTDPLWDTTNWGGTGNLWYPHVYMPNQDPTSPTGANSLGRWDYGAWFWPVFPVVAPFYPPVVSHVPEAFMDTPVINGTAYPHMNVEAAPYKLRILNACNDRMVNLQFYVADPAGHAIDAAGTSVAPGTGFGTEVKMVPAIPTTICADPKVVTGGCFPATWAVQTPGMIPDILDSRPSGVPDPALRGPAMIQIGTEGGLLPGPVLLENIPVGFEQNKRNIVVLNVLEKTLFLAPAERADVIVDFRKYAGKTIILYNDSPAPVPAGDPRYDFYTGNLDYSATGGANYQGGAPSTVAGFGPNTRTIMQFRVAAVGAGSAPGADSSAPADYYTPATLTALQNRTNGLPAIYAATQDVPIVPQAAYGLPNGPYNATYTDVAGATLARIQDLSLTFIPVGSTVASKMQMKNPTIQELFDPQGRMNATLGVELPFTGALIQTTVPLGFFEPTTETLRSGETQLWKITHNGVDTHGVHFHLVNVQVVNRVGWDGAIRQTDPNELGWKDTVRMNPLEDIIVAMKAKVPTYPFTVPNSIRLLNPALLEGSTFASLDPLTGAPITVVNAMTNFGHEYTWHCHILGHEENDMMRPLVLNQNNLLYVANAGAGISQWDNGTWRQIIAVDPLSMVTSGSTLYATFTGQGINKWDGNTWTQINGTIPTNMVASSSALYATFAGYGLAKWDGASWSHLSAAIPANMVASSSALYATFAGYGLAKWDGTSWTQLHATIPSDMVASGSDFYAKFAGHGLYKWNGSGWTQLSAAVPTTLKPSMTSDSSIYATFAGYGLAKWNGTSWTQLHTTVPTSIVPAGQILYAYFPGYGIAKWNGTAWSQMSASTPLNMVASGQILYADFAGYGVAKWESNAWTQLSPTVPASMVAGF